MKRKLLLIIGVFLLFGIVSAKCPAMTIEDESTNQCYQFPFQCGSKYYFPHPRYSKCLDSCPAGYTAGKDANSQNICTLTSCSFPNIFSFINGFYCLSSSEQDECDGGYKITDKEGKIVCLPECPAGFTITNQICSSQNSNFLWSSKSNFLNCSNIRDLKYLSCLTDMNNCNLKYTDDHKICSSNCAENYQQADGGNGLTICNQVESDFDVNTCSGSNQYISLVNLNKPTCYTSVEQIRFKTKDTNNISVDLPFCPTGFTEGIDVGLGVKTCIPPNGFSWSGNPILKCKFNKIVNYQDLTCLTNPSDCTQYLDFESKSCLKECPSDKSPFTDLNGKKFCKTSLYINYRYCPFPNIPYIAPYSKCLASNQQDLCDQVLVKDSVNNYLCLPDCPLGFTDTSTQTQKSCSSPNTFTWSQSYIVSSDSKAWNNYYTLDVDQGEAPCASDYNVYEMNACFKSCPKTFTIGSNPSITHKYCVGPENYEKIQFDIGELSQFNINKFSDYPDEEVDATSESECTDYIIKDEKGYVLCWPTCPSGYTQGTNQSGQKTCTPPSGTILKDLKFWFCDPTSVKDAANLTCGGTLADCKTNFDFRNYACLPKCIRKSEPCFNESLGVNLCKFNQKCGPPKAFNFLTRKCTLNEKECGDQYLLSDSGEYKMCVPECPSTFTKGFDSTLSLNTCTLSNGVYENTELGQCRGPNIKDFSNGKCLSSVSQCTGYYIKSQNACFTACPKGYSASTNSSGTKICSLGSGGSNTNNNNNNDEQTTRQQYLQPVIIILLLISSLSL